MTRDDQNDYLERVLKSLVLDVNRLAARVHHLESAHGPAIINIKEEMSAPVSYTHLTLPTIYSV